MPAPAPPPTLAWRLADVQAGVPVVVAPELPEVDPEPAALVALPALPEAAEVAAADEAAAEVAGGAAADDDEDEAPHPAARAPAASNGMTSQAFFTSSPHHIRN
jgi:hypothetical protein